MGASLYICPIFLWFCREKMVQNAREKALQLERKKKAAQFLAQLAEKK
jgi:hypothetical protein